MFGHLMGTTSHVPESDGHHVGGARKVADPPYVRRQSFRTSTILRVRHDLAWQGARIRHDEHRVICHHCPRVPCPAILCATLGGSQARCLFASGRVCRARSLWPGCVRRPRPLFRSCRSIQVMSEMCSRTGSTSGRPVQESRRFRSRLRLPTRSYQIAQYKQKGAQAPRGLRPPRLRQ